MTWPRTLISIGATSHVVSPILVASLISSDPQPQSPLKGITSLISQTSCDGYSSAYTEAQALGLVGGFRQIPTTLTTRRNSNIAHGVLMVLTFTIWFPFSAIVMHTTHHVYLHAAVQSFAYVNAIAGLGLGIWLGRNVRYLDYAHTVIGMAVMVALALQVAQGVWTHWWFVAGREREREKEKDMPMPTADNTGKVMRMRRIFTRGFAHRWLGRCLVALGIVNSGLGLKLARNAKGGEITYGIVAGLVGVTYLVLLLVRSWRRYRMTKEEPMAPQGGTLT